MLRRRLGLLGGDEHEAAAAGVAASASWKARVVCWTVRIRSSWRRSQSSSGAVCSGSPPRQPPTRWTRPSTRPKRSTSAGAPGARSPPRRAGRRRWPSQRPSGNPAPIASRASACCGRSRRRSPRRPPAARRPAGPRPPPTPAIAITRPSSVCNFLSESDGNICSMQLRQANPRRQGDIGESLAAGWLAHAGYRVWIPFGHSPDIDLIAQDEEQLQRIQVKTSTVFRNSRWSVAICTRGGNRSWNGIVKRLDPDRYDYLFVVVGDGRMWFIPSDQVGGRSGLVLGGPKYAAFEVYFGASVGEAGFEPA